MKIEVENLNYALDALEPVISVETIVFHHGRHLPNYVNTLAALVKGTENENKSVEEIVKTAPAGPLYNNAGQVLNHNLYFGQFAPAATRQAQPEGALLKAIEAAFGGVEQLKEELSKAAVTLFGSGWAWLVAGKDGKLSIKQCPNGANPLSDGFTPLLGIDVWEHAYYLDFHNRRPDHVKALWDIIDWKVVGERLK